MVLVQVLQCLFYYRLPYEKNPHLNKVAEPHLTIVLHIKLYKIIPEKA